MSTETVKSSDQETSHETRDETSHETGKALDVSEYGRNGSKKETRVLVCLDSFHDSAKIIAHAQAIAAGLSGKLTLLHVIEPVKPAPVPFDPVEWALQRREAEAYTAQIASDYADDPGTIETRIMEGNCAERITSCIRPNHQTIAVFYRRDTDSPWHIGGTVRKVLETGKGSLLIVPASVADKKNVRYKRILVPLDSSSRAESAVPVAARLARAHAAELELVHASPEPPVTETGPPDSETEQLRERLKIRNRRIARDYLERIKFSLADTGVKVKATVLNGSDARRLLLDSAVAGADELVVMASHGCSGHSDVPSGDVANFILTRSLVPVLMIRSTATAPEDVVAQQNDSGGVRRPLGAEPA